VEGLAREPVAVGIGNDGEDDHGPGDEASGGFGSADLSEAGRRRREL
jgi:hypothetical protein